MQRQSLFTSVKCVSAYASAALSTSTTTSKNSFMGRHRPPLGNSSGSSVSSSGHHRHRCLSTMTTHTSLMPSSASSDAEPMKFNPKRVLLLSKITRLEFERRRHPNLNEAELENLLRTRGSDYAGLRQKHEHHWEFLDTVKGELHRAGIETKIVKRFNYNEEVIQWADAIFSAGGDGTFLLAASKIKTSGKAVIGINTDPTGSEGHMCFMRKKPAEEFAGALKRLLSGDFEWLWRQRIRISLVNGNLDDPVELHDQELHVDTDDSTGTKLSEILSKESRFPLLALNEAFIGESQSSRVSYYEIQFDSEPMIKQKSSGITICTGTGSTSWHFNINKLTNQCVTELIGILKDSFNVGIEPSKENVQHIVDQFNSRLIFEPDHNRMAYSVRDAVWNATFPRVAPRGFADKIRVKSRCFDASLVIDGGISYKFNDGMEAVLEMHPEDALRTVILS